MRVPEARSVDVGICLFLLLPIGGRGCSAIGPGGETHVVVVFVVNELFVGLIDGGHDDKWE